MTRQIAEDGPAYFSIEYSKVASVPDVLRKSPHVGGQRLVGIILSIIDSHRFVERGDLLLV